MVCIPLFEYTSVHPPSKVFLNLCDCSILHNLILEVSLHSSTNVETAHASNPKKNSKLMLEFSLGYRQDKKYARGVKCVRMISMLVVSSVLGKFSNLPLSTLVSLAIYKFRIML